jgi:MraZ protein
MYFGQYEHQLDEKDRFRIPTKLLKKLSGNIYITQGSSGCLFLFSESDFAELENKLKCVPLTDVEAQKPLRALFGGADDPERDNQGRYKLRSHLKKFAGIDKDIVFVGAGPRVEIWSEQGWKAYNENKDKDNNQNQAFDKILASLSKFGV